MRPWGPEKRTLANEVFELPPLNQQAVIENGNRAGLFPRSRAASCILCRVPNFCSAYLAAEHALDRLLTLLCASQQCVGPCHAALRRRQHVELHVQPAVRHGAAARRHKRCDEGQHHVCSRIRLFNKPWHQALYRHCPGQQIICAIQVVQTSFYPWGHISDGGVYSRPKLLKPVLCCCGQTESFSQQNFCRIMLFPI